MNRNTNPTLRNAPQTVDQRVQGLSGRGVTAVLGPTNTGKTHLAIERMVAHSSGIIGLPLRLLAREVYGRIKQKVGEKNVALITGEERIVPQNAQYRVCTVEAMPAGVDASFVAIDEVQLAANLERGHVFTDRICNLRGRDETMLLGAATIRPALEALLPGIAVVTRPRMSMLQYIGSKKITRLPRRSAVVAFSADEVYAIAELIRRQRGAAAVVLGSLSPRTRNAQVELYQSGDVDYLVATDAIGMGLNLDVDHVAFAQDHKFDGFQHRRLTPAEMAQIAGRAGRHTRDGTFGVTGHAEPLSDEWVEQLETHSFAPVRSMQWRNRELSFDSVETLIRTLERPAPLVEHRTGGLQGPVLTKAPQATDQRALELMVRDEGVAERATTRERVELLWNVAQIPDYPRVAPQAHAQILANIYKDIVDLGHVDEAWLANQVRQCDDLTGDIDALSNRIAHIRTWTFVGHKSEWLADPATWARETRAVEDRLSDALHERLTKRFVDRRTSVLMRRLRENATMEAEIGPDGTVSVEGHDVGRLSGFRFTADGVEGPDAKAARAAASKALAPEIERRADRLGASANGDFALGLDGSLRWKGDVVARVVAGDAALAPRLILLADEHLTGAAREKVEARLTRWLANHVETVLKPLVDLSRASSETGEDALAGTARGLAFRLVEAFGTLDRRDVMEEVRSLDQQARARLRRLGVRFGAYHIFVPALLKPGPAGLATFLFALANEKAEAPGYGEVPQVLAQGRTSVNVDQTFDRDFYRLAGFRVLGAKAVRLDILERLADFIRPASQWKGEGKRPAGAFGRGLFFVTPAMLSILGARYEDMEAVLKALGYRAEPKPIAKVREVVEGPVAAPTEAPTESSTEVLTEAPTEAPAPEPEAADAETTGKEAAAERVSDAGATESAAVEPVAVESEGVASEADGGEGVAVQASETVSEGGEAVSQSADTAALEPVADAQGEPSEIVAAESAPEPTAEAVSEEPSEATPQQEGAEAKPVETKSDALPSEIAVPRTEETVETVLVWRRGGRQDGRQGHQGRRDGRRDGGQHRSRDARGGQRRDGSEGRDGQRDRQRAGEGERTFKGGQNGKGANGKGANGKRDQRNRSDRPQRSSQPERREKRIDPDSPFAALAALKGQLDGGKGKGGKGKRK